MKAPCSLLVAAALFLLGQAADSDHHTLIVSADNQFCNPKTHGADRNFLDNIAAINFAYAKRHGYEFRMYCNIGTKGAKLEWFKVELIKQIVQELVTLEKPTLLLVSLHIRMLGCKFLNTLFEIVSFFSLTSSIAQMNTGP